MNIKSEFVENGKAEIAKLEPRDQAVATSTLLAVVMFGSTMPQVKLDRASYSIGMNLGAALASMAQDRPQLANFFATMASNIAKKKMEVEGLGTDYPDLRPPPGVEHLFNPKSRAEHASRGGFAAPGEK